MTTMTTTTIPSPVQLGVIGATIAGDGRYVTRLELHLIGSDTVTIKLHQSVPNGGMDGEGSSLFWSTPIDKSVTHADKRELAKLVVKEVNKIIQSSAGDTIKRYGKPSLRFIWFGTDKRGVSIRACYQAIEYLTGE